MSLFTKEPKMYLGVDVGSTSVKVVELSRERNNFTLENYGIASIKDVTGTEIRNKNERAFSSSIDAISDTIRAILKEADIKTKNSVFAIPDFSSFFTSFEVPKMKRSEVESAIQFQARQRIPLPLNEVTLDWTLTGLRDGEEGEMVEVLLLAVPNETVKTYRKIAKKSGLEVGLLDAGTFGLAEVYGKEGKTIIVSDIGDQSTTVNIIEDKIPKHSHSLEISGKDFTEDFDMLPEINYNKGEENLSETSEKIKKSLSEDLAEKIKDICDSYQKEEGKNIDKIYITGGASKLKEIKKSLSEGFDIDDANPFRDLKYPSSLEGALKELSPLCSVAVGMAIKGLNSKS